MKTVGIIAEYNPFHNGHAYQIKKAKELTGADYAVIAMSGDFVQRGAPAILDKYTRAKMALTCGADLVIELPVLWAAASAESFAMAGVSLFDKMGCVDAICFGAETDDLPLLSELASILAEEPECYRHALSAGLKRGLNFPSARASALTELYGKTNSVNASLSGILSSPNNILALEYLKALRRRNSKITPILLKRRGSGYHDTTIANTIDSSSMGTPLSGGFSLSDGLVCASATAIRKALLTNCISDLKRALPENAFDILSEYCRVNPLLTQDDFSSQLAYRLLLEGSQGYDRFCDVSTDISNRLLKNRNQFLSFSDFCERNKSRDITYTRMNRILLHILLGLTTDDFLLGKKLDYIPYFRLLGFRKASSALLSDIKRCAGVPMISKLSDAGSILNENVLRMLHQDIFAAELYEQVLSSKKRTFPRSEYTREIVLL